MRLVDYFAELISLVLFARQDPDLCGKLAGENLQKKFLDHVTTVKKRCLSEGGSEEDFDMALFAVVALADESFLCSGSGLRDDWQHLYLQKTLYDTSSAGNEFFSRVARIPKEKTEILEVYLYCIGLGFKGCYYTEPKKIKNAKSSFLKLLIGEKESVYPETLFASGYPDSSSHHQQFGFSKIRNTAFNLFLIFIPAILVAGVYFYCSSSLSSILANIFGAGFK